MSQNINVKILLLKYGKLLLHKNKDEWGLIPAVVNAQEPLPDGLTRETKNICGWNIKNIRLLRINVYEEDDENEDSSGKFELVFIVEAVNKDILNHENPEQKLKWFLISDLAKHTNINKDDFESITALNNLIHKGKTLDLDSLPPVFDLRKQSSTKAIDLLAMPS